MESTVHIIISLILRLLVLLKAQWLDDTKIIERLQGLFEEKLREP
jgi:hypothetical protein